jgi:hypothetical protein
MTRFTVFEHNCHRCRFWEDTGKGVVRSGSCTIGLNRGDVTTPAAKWLDLGRVECPDFDYVPPKRTLLQRIVRLFVVP